MQFSIKIIDSFVLIGFSYKNLTPADLKDLKPPDSIANNFADKGVVLSGRGPIWLYGYLIHIYHPTKFIATYDPRLSGAVVVESHCNEVTIGDVIKIDNSYLL